MRSAGEEDNGAAPSGLGAPVLRLAGYEGPLDALLDQARAGRVDLARLPLPALVEQCVAALDTALRARREAAAAGTRRGGDKGEGASDAAPTLRRPADLWRLAEWLTMAAWLAWLRSRLLLPEHDPEARAARAEADAFRRHLARRVAVQEAADWLDARPQLGRDVFSRGAMPADVRGEGAVAERAALLHAYTRRIDSRPGQGRAADAYSPRPPRLWRVLDATRRFEWLLGEAPEVNEAAAGAEADLWRFLPDTEALTAAGLAPETKPDPALLDRSAAASTLAAALELARQGRITLAQRDGFGRIEAHPARGETAAESTRDR